MLKNAPYVVGLSLSQKAQSGVLWGVMLRQGDRCPLSLSARKRGFVGVSVRLSGRSFALGSSANVLQRRERM